MRAASLFTGIAGLDLALGVDPVVQVEREPYCLEVLALRYPGVERVADVRDYHPEPGSLDLVFGGPPCQPVSHAGRRKGDQDDRWLWPEALRIVREAMPATVFFENPMGIRTLGLDGILAELTEMGYGGAWEVVAAADVGAPHLRKRIFIMGVRGRTGWDGPTRPKGNGRVAWPTPTVEDSWGDPDKQSAPKPGAKHGWTLRAKVGEAIRYPTPTANTRPNEGNVRLYRARVLAGEMTEAEAEAEAMLNGKSPFAAQGKVPAMPTPTARLGGQRGPQAKRYFDPARSNDLDDYVAAYPGPMWPTPIAGDASGSRGSKGAARPNEFGLAKAAQMWPTPTTRDYKDTGDSIANGTVSVNGLLGRAVEPTRERGALSPDWVEWLMGVPTGWTDVTCDEPGPLHSWESEPAIPRVGLGIPNRAKRLTALGNAVVPAQGRFAYERLSERLRDGGAAEPLQLSLAIEEGA